MTEPTQPDGLMLGWGLVEALLGVLVTIGLAALGWVWTLATRMQSTQDLVSTNDEEVAEVRQAIKKLEERFELATRDLEKKIDSMRDAMPSRQFIEAQLVQLTNRLDRIAHSERRQRGDD